MTESVATKAGEPTKNFIENMKLLREKAGWTQTDLARHMVEAGWQKYTQMTVSRTEKFERPLRLDEAVSLAQLFNTSLSRMFLPSRDSDLVERLEASVENQQNARTQLKLSLKLWMMARDSAHLLKLLAEQEDLSDLPSEAAQQIANSIEGLDAYLQETLDVLVREVETELKAEDSSYVDRNIERLRNG